MPRVVKASVLHDYVVRVQFDDGYVREIDLEPELWGGDQLTRELTAAGRRLDPAAGRLGYHGALSFVRGSFKWRET